ncbi:MAG: tryptophan synthase subunit beta, partial [archaeon]|nr:tryptophan synthase subunit beta [archaeon]
MKEFVNYPIDGKYGRYGGCFIPETLMSAVLELERAYLKLKNDQEFKREL